MARTLCILLIVAIFTIGFVQTDAKVTTTKPVKIENIAASVKQNYLPGFTYETLRKLQERLIRYRRLLAAANANRGCLDERDRKLYEALEALEAARICLYSGLPPAYHEAISTRCALLPGAKEAVKKYEHECSHYKGSNRYKCRSEKLLPAKDLAFELEAVCKRISEGPYGPKSCPAIKPLEDAVDALRKQDCGTGIYTYKEIIEAIKDTQAKIKQLLNGNALPSNDPRYFNVPL